MTATTIAVRTKEKCECCGEGQALNHKETGARAAKWRRAVNVSQRSVAENGMGIKQSFYSALELGQRHWTPALIEKFETVIVPLLNQKRVEIEKL
jgi:predicted transcriptional regulator